ncbi:MAG: cardiolipin synthase [Lachnospira sp.]
MAGMRTELKTSVKNSAGRLFATILFALLQILWLISMSIFLNGYSTLATLVFSIIAIIIVLKMYGDDSVNSSMKMSWIVLILPFPILGLGVYLVFGRSLVTKGMRTRFATIDKELSPKFDSNDDILKKIDSMDTGIANQFRYIKNYGGYPTYDNTDIDFYADATQGLEAQIQAIKSAKHFIFMEYHAIESAEGFNKLKSALIEKAHEGVEVRIFYDDVGSIFFLNHEFIKEMVAEGIQCRVFNPIKILFNMFMNNRDHRKITVIDGKVGFTGGYNLADEYFNITHPYGYWKDTGIRIRGEAVRSLTIMFLGMWNSIKKTDTDYDKYLDIKDFNYEAEVKDNYVAPYADSPLKKEPLAENVYLNILKNAKRYVYIMTPYLIITDEMSRELGLAAKRGIDVRIITPGIPDKKIVYRMTRSYYPRLVADGVKIYEYTPGFCHAKQWVSDDEISVVGTINADYRSLYHHFENAVLTYGHKSAMDVKNDFLVAFKESEDVTGKYIEKASKPKSLGQCILRIMSPLF